MLISFIIIVAWLVVIGLQMRKTSSSLNKQSKLLPGFIASNARGTFLRERDKFICNPMGWIQTLTIHTITNWLRRV